MPRHRFECRLSISTTRPSTRSGTATPHTDAARLGKTVYGLPELFGDKIPPADLIANPGCYTSTSILGLAPFLCNRLIEPKDIIIDAKSGVTGAGRTPKLHILYAECNESFSAYSVGNHRHEPEIDQVLSQASGRPVETTFTPHMVPMDRGILCTMYARPLQASDAGRRAARRCGPSTGQAVRARRRSSSRDEGRRPHELLPHDGPLSRTAG